MEEIKNMKKLKWYFNHGKNFELFSALYEKDGWMVVKNDNTEKYSFGLSRDFGTLLGFPVNQSCLSSDEIKNVLEDYILKLPTPKVESAP